MTKNVHVELGTRSYDITIGNDLPMATTLSESDVRALVVSDSNVDPLHGDACSEKLKQQGIDPIRMVVPAGEGSKCFDQLQIVLAKALDEGLDRSSVIVALGGGVVGDLAGFAAATFLRGVRLVQVPTTLLAMVDSSVGGKTGINVAQGKNLVGAFYQPVEVTVDLSTLGTLPEREYVSGLAEVLKYGVIWDEKMFAMLEDNAERVLDREPELLADIVARCCEIKAEVVSKDEREGGLRAILNFGHTLAHALEKNEGYGRKLHGEAVAVGMAYACMLSVAKNGMAQADCDRVIALLDRFGLPRGLDGVCLDWADVRKAMSADKKTLGSVPRFVLVEKIGSVQVGCEIEDEMLESVFNALF